MELHVSFEPASTAQRAHFLATGNRLSLFDTFPRDESAVLFQGQNLLAMAEFSFPAYCRGVRHDEPLMFVHRLASAREGCGFGSMLLRALEDRAVEGGCVWVILQPVSESVSFYQRKGYLPRYVPGYPPAGSGGLLGKRLPRRSLRLRGLAALPSDNAELARWRRTP